MPPKKKTTKGKSAGQKTVVPSTNKRVKVPQKKKQRNKDQAMGEAKTNSPPPPPTDPAFPIEIFRNILKFALPRELSRCMRVSEAFWEMAGPLLYSNLVIKRAQPMHKVVHGLPPIVPMEDPQPINRKTRLLSHVQQITVADHLCLSSWISSDRFPNLKTLLVLPYAHLYTSDWICGDSRSCPILSGFQPQKIVMHNSRTANPGISTWPMGLHPLRVTCPTLTLVINDIECAMGRLPHMNWISYHGVRWKHVKHIRVIVNRTPPWLDKIAERLPYPNRPRLTSQRLVEGMLSPLIAGSRVPLTFYLFQEMDEAYMTCVQETLPTALNNIPQRPLNPLPRHPPVPYTIKTLSDYITEGLEDELIWQELKYWREENQRRMENKEMVQ